MEATVVKDPPVSHLPLFVPPLEEVVAVLNGGLKSNFETVNVEVVDCPDLTKEPFSLAAEGLGGKPRLIEVGGQSYIFPVVKKEKLYDLRDIAKLVEVEPAFLIGASAGPWPYMKVNTEMMVNLIINDGKVINRTHVTLINENDGSCVLESLPENETRCAILANLFCCEGKPGKVLKVSCKKRTGVDDFPSSIRRILQAHYKDEAVGLGGTFLLKSGKAKVHLMSDFSTTPLSTDEEVANWFHYFNMSAPLTAVGTLLTADPDLGLRLQHFHTFSQHGEGGHYHTDTEPDDAEYLGYFTLCEHVYRVDKPDKTGRIGID